jgi:hypothetical protein
MGNLVSEMGLRIYGSWRREVFSTVLTALATFFISNDRISLIRALEAAALVMGLWFLFHLGAILWKLRIVTGLRDGDPRIEVSFIDERKEVIPTPYSAALELKNRGASDAMLVRIASLKLRKRVVDFPGYSDVIAPTDYRRFRAEVGNHQWGYQGNHDLIRAMSEEWLSYEDHDTRREIYVPLRVDYEDAQGVHYEMKLELLYHGGKSMNQPVDFKCIECRNFQYRRIVAGGFEPYKGAK